MFATKTPLKKMTKSTRKDRPRKNNKIKKVMLNPRDLRPAPGPIKDIKIFFSTAKNRF